MSRPEHKDLFPDREVTLPRPGGQAIEVTVQAFRFARQFRAEKLAKPILDDLANIDLSEMDGSDAEALFDLTYEVFAQHDESLHDLMALSTGREAAWIRELPSRDGRLLMFEFIDANYGFFLSLLEDRKRMLTAAATVELASQKSSTTSSPADTDEALKKLLPA